MRIERLARDEQPHDLAGAFENRVDAAVPEHSLDRRWLVSPCFQGVGRFVTAAAPNLHGVVDDLPGHFAAPHLAHRRFEPNVRLLVAVNQAGGVKRHGLHRECIRRHASDPVGNGGVFADGRTPLHPLPGPLANDFQTALRKTYAAGRQCQAPRVQRRKRDPQPFALGEDYIFARHADIGEANDAVVQRPQSHEPAAMRDLHARRVHLDDERRDLVFRLAIHQFRRRPGHDDDDAGFGAVGAPQFFAVQHEMFSVGRRLGVGLHFRRIRADPRFRQGKGRNFPLRHAREELSFLNLVAEKDERLRHANGLVCGNQRREIAAVAAQQNRGPAIIRLRQAEPAVARRNLYAEGAHGGEFPDGLRRDFAGPVDFIRVNLLTQKFFKPLQKCVTLIAVFGLL